MDLKDKKIVIIGAGISGIAAAKIAKKSGASVIISDTNTADKIRYDFGWSKIINIHPVKVTWESPEEKEISYSKISFSPMPFTKKHHEFWNCVWYGRLPAGAGARYSAIGSQ